MSKEDFENLGEFFATIMHDRNDPRLQSLYRSESRTTMQMGTGSLGGFAVPAQFWNQVLSAAPQAGIIRAGAVVLPQGEPPQDAEIKIPALDQSGSNGVYGGFDVVHSGEAYSITESHLNLRQVTLKPKEIKGYIILSAKLIDNWPLGDAYLTIQLKRTCGAVEDYDFLRGNGVNRALGIINAPCRIEISRTTASQIAYDDILGMAQRAKLSPEMIWIASSTCLTQLANSRDAGGNCAWIKSTVAGQPGTMFDMPLYFSERAPALGSRGDLCLVDRSYYCIKDGSGPRVDISREFLFQNDEVCFRIVWNVDGASWLQAPVPLEGSTSDTVSPFVILN